MKDEEAGLEIAGLENDGLENDGVEQEQTYAFKVIGYCLRELEQQCDRQH